MHMRANEHGTDSLIEIESLKGEDYENLEKE